MIELGELEANHQEFAKRNVKVIVVAQDDLETTKLTQADFPHLTVVSDPGHKMADVLSVNHPGEGPGGHDTNAPTTFLVDGQGTVRWVYRPERFIVRLSPKELLAAVDEWLVK